MKKLLPMILLLAALVPGWADELSEHDANAPVGWAAVRNTVGNEDQNVMTASNFSELKSALNARGLAPYI